MGTNGVCVWPFWRPLYFLQNDIWMAITIEALIFAASDISVAESSDPICLSLLYSL